MQTYAVWCFLKIIASDLELVIVTFANNYFTVIVLQRCGKANHNMINILYFDFS